MPNFTNFPACIFIRPSDHQERRVQLRCGPPGDAVGTARSGQEPAERRARPGGVGEAVPEEQAAHLPRPGPPAGRAVLPRQGAEGRVAGAAVPLRGFQAKADHGAGRHGARAAPRRQGGREQPSPQPT